MGKSILKRLGALALCAALTGGTALAGNTVYRTITVQYSGIKLVVDGVEVTPKDANGTTVEPFIYNGTTYLPVRAVGNAIGKQVTWDGGSQTVYLGEAPGSRTWLMDVCPPYETSHLETAVGSFKMAGETYTHGFYSTGLGNLYTSEGLFNLDGKYSTLSCDIGLLDGAGKHDNRRVEIYLDGDLSQVIEIPNETMVKHFDIPLQNALQLKIWISHPSVGFANCELS